MICKFEFFFFFFFFSPEWGWGDGVFSEPLKGGGGFMEIWLGIIFIAAGGDENCYLT